MTRTRDQKQIPKRSAMYRVVFDSVAVKCGVFLLFVFLLLQPIAPAFADEVAATEPPTEIVADTESIVVESQEEIIEEPPQETETVETVEPEIDEPQEEILEEELPAVVSEEENDDESIAPSTIAESDPSQATTSNDSADLDSENAEETGDSDTIAEDIETDTVSDEEADEPNLSDDETEAPQTQASTTEEAALVVDHNANQLQFDPAQCASVGDGAFYCSTPKELGEFKEDGVFAAPDADGDMEIFVRLDGEETQLTSNLTDDNAPYYDALSDRIVWHASHNDRYQIMSYDMRTNEKTRLTNTSYNNMEPVAYGDITMYQSWIDNNWEIMYHDGTELRRLTTNTHHDVSPSIRGGYIVWQSQFADGWQVAVYDQKTDHIEYVKSEGGAKVENPRFVLVYDSTNTEGDVQTLGYDFDNKQAFTLNNIPADLPDELPDPDQTGETRALLQSKQSIRGTEIQEDDIVPTNTATSTPTTTPNSDIPPVDLTSPDAPQASASTSTAAITDELVIPSFDTATATQEVSHISDILIPPFQAASSTEVR